MKNHHLLWCLLSTSVFAGSVAATASTIPSFTVNELLTSTSRSDELASILTTTGLLAIETEFGLDRQVALDGLCLCADGLKGHANVDHVTLGDQVTFRTTLATATVGNTPLPLSDSSLPCGSDTITAMENLRDHVATASNAFVVALDRLLGVHTPILTTSHDLQYSSVSSILAGANHLEHFHIYDKKVENENNKDTATLEWHTDAGLFLAFVPAWDCDESSSKSSSSSFYAHGDNIQFSPNSVVIMLGAGAEHWLRTPVSLKATRHAVQMQTGESRAWYGMMHLVPEDAIIQASPRKTFADMKKSMTLSTSGPPVHGESQQVAIGCGNSPPESTSTTSSTATTRRRRLQHVESPAACNNVTNFFCWMSCLDIPDYDESQQYLDLGYSLYCVDPAILASTSSITQASDPCVEVHNANCLGSWQPTDPNLAGAEVVVDPNYSSKDQPFCYGGTSMYMDGFHWTDTTCVIYLFPQWVLTTKGRLVGAAFGTFFFGIALEMVISQRRRVISSFSSGGYYRLAASALFYGLQLTMGYFLMLVVMTYSGPLFMCTIFGIMGGHVLFNAKDAPFAKWGEPKTNHSAGEEKKCCSKGSEEPEQACPGEAAENHGVPEGSTPCCQHTL